MMKLVFHGGKCCGIKTIYGFDYDPHELQPACSPQDPIYHDINGSHVCSSLSFFTDEAPEEPAVKRLDRLIAFCEKKRPQGIIEITLADNILYPYYDQIEIWAPLIRRRKFKCVNKCKNSNSGNTVYVFHRNSGEGK